MERFTITYHHTTKDGFKIYHLQDMTREKYNDGRSIIYSDLEYCKGLKEKLIKEPVTEQLQFDLN